MSGPIKVLLLAADPDRGTGGLRIDHDIRGAVDAARMGGAAHPLEIRAELAVSQDDLLPLLLRHSPQVVQFSGHGSGGRRLVLDDGTLVGAGELAALLSSVGGVRVVVLNACGLLELGTLLTDVVDYVVAMELPVRDAAAIQFTGAFYAALAFGRTVPAAFDVARSSTQARFGSQSGIPRLLAREGAEARPLVEAAPPPVPPAAGSIIQVNDVEDAEAEESAEVTNVARAPDAAVPVEQCNRVKGIKAGGSLKIGSTLK